MFDSAAKAIPIGQRDPVQHSPICAAQIQQYDPKASGMNDKIGGAHCVFGVAATSDPNQAIQRDTRSRGKRRVKSVVKVDKRTDFGPFRCLSQNMHRDRRTA